jgi:signal transduction histidine kinase
VLKESFVKLRLKPGTIRGQLMSGLILFEVLALTVFSIALMHEQRRELQTRTDRRLEYQASLLAIQSSAAMADHQYETLDGMITALRDAPSIRAAQITDLQGRTLFSSDPTMKGKLTLSPRERMYLRELSQPVIFSLDDKTREAVAPVLVRGSMQGLVWIYPDNTADQAELRKLLAVTMIWAIFGLVGLTIIAGLMARSIARPIGTLMDATRRIIDDPEHIPSTILEVGGENEAAALARAFNLMLAAIEKQRGGLKDTLAMLDSMLANAPIGFAFFDRQRRFVRVNRVLANIRDLRVASHVGGSVNDVFSGQAAALITDRIGEVFEHGRTVQNVELVDEENTDHAGQRSWLTNLYPVRTESDTIRWAGMILVETTERRRVEEALRRTEKLAAAGRLAASIAHEINNPLEALTNLLFLIREASLDAETAGYAQLASQQIAHLSEITQQALRFYRQSTHPKTCSVPELLDSVLGLYQPRLAASQIKVSRYYSADVQLFCFAGELRQLFANLITNALDAMTPDGGSLSIRIRYAQSLDHREHAGVRITIADTGVGMTNDVQRRIFEPFFTTKDPTGTGLGLWISSEIVSKHHGSIRVRSCARSLNADASGSVFSVFFPLVPEPLVS